MKTDVLVISLMLIGGSAFAQEYPQQMAISRAVAAGVVSDQRSVETIVASNGVSQGATVRYTAGKSVTLQPGFVAQAGSVFTATVAPVASLRSASDVPGLSVRAYPNPFVGQTTIEYNLPSGGRVQHTLLDINGQVVRQSDAQTEQPAGRHQTQLDGTNLPVGAYLYRIQLGTESQTLRLLKK